MYKEQAMKSQSQEPWQQWQPSVSSSHQRKYTLQDNEQVLIRNQIIQVKLLLLIDTTLHSSLQSGPHHVRRLTPGEVISTNNECTDSKLKLVGGQSQ